MRRIIKLLLLVATVGLVWTPVPARADGYVSPFAGVNFGNNSGDGSGSYGLHAGWMGAGVIGCEADLGWAPGFFGSEGRYGANHVADIMGNLIVGVPVGGTHGKGFRPYLSVGAGLLRTQITGGVNGTSEFSDNEWGMNGGVGAMGFFNDHVGVRGDVRYFRNLSGDTNVLALHDFNVDAGAFHFWRASLGVVFR